MNEINVQMDAPVAGEDLPMGAKEYTVLTDFVKYTVPSENVAVAWNESGGKAEYNKEYSAMITIPAKVDGKYAFALAKDEIVTVNVNGKTIPKESLSFDSTTGNISIVHKFEKTAKSKLLSILPPMPSGLLPNGTAFEDIGLPQTVLIDVEGQSMQRAPVTWKMAPNEVYDPADPKAQSFLMHGSVTIPEDIDVNGIPTDKVPCIVDVAAAPVPIALPTASPASGTYTGPLSVVLACSTQGAKIYYTMDGSSPAVYGLPYTVPLQLPVFEDRTGIYNIKVIAIKDDIDTSEIVTFSYTIPAKGKQTVTITSPTQNTVVSVQDGTTANLSIIAEGDIASYQWETNTGSGFANVIDATSTQYTTPALTKADDGREYRCTVLGRDGTAVTSHVFTIRIGQGAPDNPQNAPTNAQTQKTQGKKAQNPKILQPTADVSVPVALGEVTSLAITAANTVSYQWELDLGDGFKLLPGADKAHYKTPPITAQENGYRYRCIATGAKGTTPAISPVFTLALIEAPPETSTEFKILSPTQDTSITLDEGETAALSVTATGATSYQWQRSSGIAF
ncbi:MAG: chitobiase/beta-hexosaminidase C-terminal domain-containing protein, partial [Christensenellaceae bacterium]